MWRFTLQSISIATHMDRIDFLVLFHKQFYRYWSSGWVPRGSCRWKLENERLKLYVVFSKSITQSRGYV